MNRYEVVYLAEAEDDLAVLGFKQVTVPPSRSPVNLRIDFLPLIPIRRIPARRGLVGNYSCASPLLLRGR
jgi:hypothetical protein